LTSIRIKFVEALLEKLREQTLFEQMNGTVLKRSSNAILAERLTPETLGKLIALYETSTAS
jgi:glucose-6-phosphate isomerase